MRKILRVFSLITLCIFTTGTRAALLVTGDRLAINPGVVTYDSFGDPNDVTGSWVAHDGNADNKIQGVEKIALAQGTEGIIIGAVQGLGSPTHFGAPLASDWNRLTNPYAFLGGTAAEYTISPIIGGTTGLDFSGLRWSWDNLSASFSGGAWGAGFTDGIASLVWDGVYGDSYTLEYRTTIAAGDPSGLGGARFAYHIEGVVTPVPIPPSAWLLLSALGFIGFSLRRRR